MELAVSRHFRIFNLNCLNPAKNSLVSDLDSDLVELLYPRFALCPNTPFAQYTELYLSFFCTPHFTTLNTSFLRLNTLKKGTFL